MIPGLFGSPNASDSFFRALIRVSTLIELKATVQPKLAVEAQDVRDSRRRHGGLDVNPSGYGHF